MWKNTSKSEFRVSGFPGRHEKTREKSEFRVSGAPGKINIYTRKYGKNREFRVYLARRDPPGDLPLKIL